MKKEIILLLITLLLQPVAGEDGSPPINDACVDSLELKYSMMPFRGSTIDATHHDVPICSGNDSQNNGLGVWYKFYGGDGNRITASLCGETTSFDTQLSVYEGDCENLKCAGGNDDFCGLQSEISWTTKVGTMYYVYVHGYGDATGEFELVIQTASIPENDICEDAIMLEIGDPPFVGQTIGASYDEVSCLGYRFSSVGVWYSFIGVSDDGVIAGSCSNYTSGFETWIVVFEGDCNHLVCIDAMPCELAWPTKVGSSYYVYVAGNDNATGAYNLTIQPYATTVNDVCENSIEMEIGDQPLKGSVANATFDANTFANKCDVNNYGYHYGIWYTFQGDGNGVIASLCNNSKTTFDSEILIYEGNDCTSLVCVGGNDNYCGLQSAFAWNTKFNARYYIYVYGRPDEDDPTGGDFELSVLPFSPPENDRCEDATELEIGDPPTAGHTIGATYDDIIMTPCHNKDPKHGVWYTFQGDGNDVSVSLLNNTSYDIQISLYTGSTCIDLVCFAGGNGYYFYENAIAWRTNLDTRYYIYVHGYGDDDEYETGEQFGISLEPYLLPPEKKIEHKVLAAMHASLGGDWYGNDFGHCNWDGIQCSGNLASLQITDINLFDMNLNGTIPSEIGMLTRIRGLTLSSNNVRGTIPTEIAMLTNLGLLQLSENDLTGTIPTEIGMLVQLTGLRMFGNHLMGTLASNIGKLSNVEFMRLDYNDLTGAIITEIGMLSNMYFLRLDNNELTGTMPTEIGMMSRVEHLYLHNNNLTGTLPSQIGMLELESLLLSGNDLTGTLSSQIGLLTNLRLLYLNENNFTGSLPSKVGLFSNLEQLHSAGNRLTGSIPAGVGNLTKLQELSLQDNLLNGTFDVEDLGQLIVLNISQNQLSGFAIAKEVPLIRTFDISNNRIVFEIESNFLELLRNAQDVILSNNLIHGQLPNIRNGRLINLLRLDIDNNCLSGELPFTYDIAMPRLEELRFSYGGRKCRVRNLDERWDNVYDGRSVKYDGYCFREADCSMEGSGEIRKYCCGDETQLCTEYGKISALVEECYYHLYRIGLWGPLPPSLSQFSNLRVLNLANNLLTGQIPADIGDGLPRIALFNIRNNNFHGKIPSEIAGIGSSSETAPTISLGGNRFSDSVLAPLGLCLLEDKFDLYNSNETWCPRERNILTYFFDESKGVEWTNSSNWIDAYKSHCQWYGIECNENNAMVKQISLGNNGLSGRITTRIGDLTSLQKLDLSDNDLKGSIPTFPTALSDVRLSYNSLTGEVPELRNLTKLAVLYLHSNRLQGELFVASQNIGSAIADCGSPSEFKDPLSCPNCTFCCNYLGECDENTNENNRIFLLGECSQDITDPVLGLHINSCSIQEGAVFILYTIAACTTIWMLSSVSKRVGTILQDTINWQEFNLPELLGENSVYIFILSTSVSGWIIATVVWIFQIYVYFLFVDASAKKLSQETDWIYRYRCARNAGDENCENTTAVSQIGVILGIIIMVINLMKDLACGLKLIWIVPHRNESIRIRMRCLIGATLLFTVTSFAIYSSVVYNQATAMKDTDFIYNSVVLIFLNSLDEWCFAVVQVICPNWLKAILKEIDANREGTARQQWMDKVQRETEAMGAEIEAVRKEVAELKIENERGQTEGERNKSDIEEIRKEIQEAQKQNDKKGDAAMSVECQDDEAQTTIISKAEFESLKQENERNKKEIEKLIHENKEMKTGNEEMKKTYKDYQDITNNLVRRLQELEKQMVSQE